MLEKFIASNDLVAVDTACARMMGFNPEGIQHLRNLSKFLRNGEERTALETNDDLTAYDWAFSLHRNLVDALSFACFHNDLLAKVVFDSPTNTSAPLSTRSMRVSSRISREVVTPGTGLGNVKFGFTNTLRGAERPFRRPMYSNAARRSCSRFAVELPM